MDFTARNWAESTVPLVPAKRGRPRKSTDFVYDASKYVGMSEEDIKVKIAREKKNIRMRKHRLDKTNKNIEAASEAARILLSLNNSEN